MSLYARPKPPRLLALLIIFVYLVFSCFLLETTRFRAEKPRSAQMLEAAERTELLLLEQNQLVNHRHHFEDFIGRRFHHPADMAIRIPVLQGISHRQGMEHIADGT